MKNFFPIAGRVSLFALGSTVAVQISLRFYVKSFPIANILETNTYNITN